MKKVMVILLIGIIVLGFTGCETKSESQAQIEMTEEVQQQFYKDGSELLLDMSNHFNNEEFKFSKVNILKEKYDNYIMNEEQEEFYSLIKLCISDLMVYQDGLKSNDSEGMKIGKQAFSYDFEEAVNFIEDNNLINEN